MFPSQKGNPMDPLLRKYIDSHSAEAFRELVERHIHAVHSQARRRLHDADAAHDVTQAVFLMLSQKADRLPEGTVLAGWLFRATRYACNNAQRAADRRLRHERKAAEMRSDRSASESEWAELEPVLDDAIGELRQADRDAILLRYFEQLSVREVGQRLGVSEDAAKQRVSRAVEKLRGILARRGATVAAAALATTLATNAVQAAPAAVVVSTSGVVGGGASAGATTIAKGAFTMMNVAKAKVAAAVVLGAVALAGAGAFAVHQTLATQPAAEAPADPPADPKQVVAVDPQIQGEWESAIPGDGVSVRIDDGRMTHVIPGGESVSFEIVRNDATGEPRELDLLILEDNTGGERPGEHVGKTMLVSYQLQDGLLLLMASPPGSGRWEDHRNDSDKLKKVLLKRKVVAGRPADAGPKEELMKELEIVMRTVSRSIKAGDEQTLYAQFVFSEPPESDGVYLMLPHSLALAELRAALAQKPGGEGVSVPMMGFDDVLDSLLAMSDVTPADPEQLTVAEDRAVVQGRIPDAVLGALPPDHPFHQWKSYTVEFQRVDGQWKWDVRNAADFELVRQGEVLKPEGDDAAAHQRLKKQLVDQTVAVLNDTTAMVRENELKPQEVRPYLESEMYELMLDYGATDIRLMPRRR